MSTPTTAPKEDSLVHKIFRTCLEIQATRSSILLAMARNDGRAESELRAVLHELTDRELDLQNETMREAMRNMK